MRLGTRRVIAAPLDSVWATLLDVHRVAAAFPGVTLTTVGADGVSRGQLALGADRYNGSMVLEEVDEDQHDVAFRARGRTERGCAAVATVRGGCRRSSSGTTLVVTADVSVTGDACLEQDAAETWLAAFTTELEGTVLRDTAEPSIVRLGERGSRVLRLAAVLTCGTAIAAAVVLLRRRAARLRIGDR